MEKIKVGVLRGGKSPNANKSLRSGSNILRNIPQEKYKSIDILITTDGLWHINGIPALLDDLLFNIDVFFNTLGGGDESIYQTLNNLLSPYVGSGLLASRFQNNRGLLRKWIKNTGIKTPKKRIISLDQSLNEMTLKIFSEISPPWLVRPVIKEGFTDFHLTNSFDELGQAIHYLSDYPEGILVEEYINGEKVSCGVINDFREQKHYSLLPMGENKNLNSEEKEEIQNIARQLHQILGLNHYSNSNFLITPKKKIYFTGIDIIPDLSPKSSFIASLQEVGCDLPDFLDHVITLAYEGK